MKWFKLRKTKKLTMKALLKTLNNYSDELRIAKNSNVILLENSAMLRAKIKDLENNIEFLASNSQNKKLKEIRG